MAPRPHWKGYLKLSLVSCPIGLYPAIASEQRLSFRQVNRRTGNRLRQQLVDAVTGEAVERHEKARGYEVGENDFLFVEDQELVTAEQRARTRPIPAALAPAPEPVPPPRTTKAGRKDVIPLQPEAEPEEEPEAAPPPVENNRTIEIERFVPRSQINSRYYDTPYYIAPREAVGQEAYAVIRDAMRGKELIGMGRVVLARRERPIIIEPLREGLRGTTLRFAHEIRSEAEYFSDIPEMILPGEMLKIAEHILDTKSEDFDPAMLEDRYRTALVSLLRKKQSAAVPKHAGVAAPSRENVINLMDALRRSLAGSDRSGPGTKPSAPKSSPRAAAALKPPPAKRGARSRKTG